MQLYLIRANYIYLERETITTSTPFDMASTIYIVQTDPMTLQKHAPSKRNESHSFIYLPHAPSHRRLHQEFCIHPVQHARHPPKGILLRRRCYRIK